MSDKDESQRFFEVLLKKLVDDKTVISSDIIYWYSVYKKFNNPGKNVTREYITM